MDICNVLSVPSLCLARMCPVSERGPMVVDEAPRISLPPGRGGLIAADEKAPPTSGRRERVS
jgi:hypothetical protein